MSKYWHRQMIYVCPDCGNTSYHSTIALVDEWVDPVVEGVQGCKICNQESTRKSTNIELERVLHDVELVKAQVSGVVKQWLLDNPTALKGEIHHIKWSSFHPSFDEVQWFRVSFEGIENGAFKRELQVEDSQMLIRLADELNKLDLKLLKVFNIRFIWFTKGDA